MRNITHLLLLGITLSLALNGCGPNPSPAGNLNSLSGIVIDVDSSKAVSDVYLAIYENDKIIQSTMSEKDGQFAITGLPKGTYTLISSKEGFTTSTQQILKPEDETAAVMLFLRRLSPAVPIGNKGGTLSITDGRASLTVPSGALEDETSLSMTALPLTPLNSLGEDSQFFYLGVYLQPDGLVFSQPVTITFELPILLPDSVELPLWLYDSETDTKPESFALTIGESGRTAQGMITHFSLAILGLPLNYTSVSGPGFPPSIPVPPTFLPIRAPTLPPIPVPAPGEGGEEQGDECSNGESRLKSVEEQEDSINLPTRKENLCDGTCKLYREELSTKYLVFTPEYCENNEWVELPEVRVITRIEVKREDIGLEPCDPEETCPTIYEGKPFYTQKTTICSCSGCDEIRFIAEIVVDVGGNVSGVLRDVGTGYEFISALKGTRELITGENKIGPGNCGHYTTIKLQAHLSNNNQKFEGILEETHTPGDCRMDNCDGTYTFSLDRK